MAELSSLEQGLFYLAITVTLIFAIQTFMTFMGGGEDADFDGDGFDLDGDMDADSDGFADSSFLEYFTLRNLIAFFLGFSWGALALMEAFIPSLIALPIAFVIGVAVVWVNFTLMRGLSKLVVSGNIDITKAVGHEGAVSIQVPANQRGLGKVYVSFGGRHHELTADTLGDALKRGRQVKVVAATPDKITVEPLS